MELDTFKIKIMLAERGWSQTKLAEMCGVTRQNISIMLSRGTCYTFTAGKIAAGLGVHVSEIIKDEK